MIARRTSAELVALAALGGAAWLGALGCKDRSEPQEDWKGTHPLRFP
jgi:hypothetical protein